MATIRPFARQGNFTVIDNYILDEIMPNLPPNAWKVLCFIIRKTVGWHKQEDALPYSQIMEGTGIANRNTVSNALKELIDRGYIIARSTSHWSAIEYRLNTDFEAEIQQKKGESPSTEIVPDTSTEIVPDTSTEIVHSKEKKEREERRAPENSQNHNGASDDDSSSTRNHWLLNLLNSYGVLIGGKMQEEVWYSLLELTPDDNLIEAAFQESIDNGKQPAPKYIRSIITRCLQDGLMPGVWRNGNGHNTSGSPVRATAMADGTFKLPNTGGRS